MGLTKERERLVFILCMNTRSVSSPLREPGSVFTHTDPGSRSVTSDRGLTRYPMGKCLTPTGSHPADVTLKTHGDLCARSYSLGRSSTLGSRSKRNKTEGAQTFNSPHHNASAERNYTRLKSCDTPSPGLTASSQRFLGLDRQPLSLAGP
ncbi:hypothetical protein AB205_0029200, partial [Aquarana catesbeiana]